MDNSRNKTTIEVPLSPMHKDSPVTRVKGGGGLMLWLLVFVILVAAFRSVVLPYQAEIRSSLQGVTDQAKSLAGEWRLGDAAPEGRNVSQDNGVLVQRGVLIVIKALDLMGASSDAHLNFVTPANFHTMRAAWEAAGYNKFHFEFVPVARPEVLSKELRGATYCFGMRAKYWPVGTAGDSPKSLYTNVIAVAKSDEYGVLIESISLQTRNKEDLKCSS